MAATFIHSAESEQLMPPPQSLLLILFLMLNLACSGAPVKPQLSPSERQDLVTIYQGLREMALLELARPVALERSELDEEALAERLRRSIAVSHDFDHPYFESALNLGMVYSLGGMLGWPAAPQIAEYYLQQALLLRAKSGQAYEALSFLHLSLGDIDGARYYAQLMRQNSTELGIEAQILLAMIDLGSGEKVAAFSALGEIIANPAPDKELMSGLAEIIILSAKGGGAFTLPSEFDAMPGRPEGTLAGLRFPFVDYKNLNHGFFISYPVSWTLYDEETAYPLSRCFRLAELTLDLPLALEQPAVNRVRILALPIDFGTSSEEFAEHRIPIYKYPELVEGLAPVIADSVHQHYWDDDQEGEMVFLARGQVGFFFHYFASPQAYREDRDRFHEVLSSFRTSPPLEIMPPECREDLPSAYSPDGLSSVF